MRTHSLPFLNRVGSRCPDDGQLSGKVPTSRCSGLARGLLNRATTTFGPLSIAVCLSSCPKKPTSGVRFSYTRAYTRSELYEHAHALVSGCVGRHSVRMFARFLPSLASLLSELRPSCQQRIRPSLRGSDSNGVPGA
ncbi:uncharacterized protein YALI1_D12877g [Yarrowia lipolytica]|uniref:Uncharacterized protein n=1 Tax=Yarrowia lipolytica TaxID=4952 RepID=A0A1D8NE27_YARLL|nr:hypothetical protein YALI1_D12877g [Yarrowia lipolytica]